MVSNSKEQSYSLEADSGSLGNKFPRLLWSQILHSRVHKSPPLVPVLSHMILFTPRKRTSLRSIIPTSVLRYSGWLLPFMFRTKILYASLISRMLSTCPTYLKFLGLIRCKLCSSSLCDFLHSFVTSSPFGANIFLSTLFSYILPSISVPVQTWETHSHTHTKTL